MGKLQGIKFNKINGGLGRATSVKDNISLLVIAMSISGTSLAYGMAKELIQTKDAEVLGITPATDANNKSLAYYHISENFRLAPDSKLYILPVEANSTIQSKVDITLQTLRKYREIKGVGFAGFTNNLSTIPGEVDVLQVSLVQEAAKDGIDLDYVLIEGRGTADVIDINDMVDLRSKKAPNISVIIAQDRDIVAQDAAYKNTAAIGSALGMINIRRVHENLGSVDVEQKPSDSLSYDTYPLTNSGLKRFMNAGLSIGKTMDELTNEQLKALNEKGYIFAGQYEAEADFYFNNSSTCVSFASDYSYIERNRTWNKAKRLIGKTLLPKVKSKVPKDPQTGFVRSTTIANWTTLLEKALDTMVITDEISGYSIYMNPEQSPDEQTPFKVKGNLVAHGIVHEFEVDLGLTNKI